MSIFDVSVFAPVSFMRLKRTRMELLLGKSLSKLYPSAPKKNHGK
jgi:hypothetical protein